MKIGFESMFTDVGVYRFVCIVLNVFTLNDFFGTIPLPNSNTQNLPNLV